MTDKNNSEVGEFSPPVGGLILVGGRIYLAESMHGYSSAASRLVVAFQ